MEIEAGAHDRAMAYVSHAPQLVASAVYSVARAGVSTAGPGFRDVTRISAVPRRPGATFSTRTATISRRRSARS
jgi:prephenate dehydrogenase